MTKKLRKYWLISILSIVVILGLFYLMATNTALGKAFGKAVSDSFVVFDSVTVDGTSQETSYINWVKLKNFIILIGLISIVLIAALSYVISQMLIRKDREKIASLIDQSMTEQSLDVDNSYLPIKNSLKQMQLQNRENQEKLQAETQRTKDLVTYLAHDLRTPLSSVIGYLNLLSDTPEITPATRQKYLQVSLDKAEHLGSLIEEFFDITRFNFQHIVLNYSQFNLYHLLQQLAEEFYPQLKGKGQTIELDLPEDFEILADPDKLARVFNNILKNAIAYSSSNDVIEISASKSDKWVEIEFKNNGPEIPAARRNTIFDKFYRLDNSRNTKNGGAGLGLAIAQDIVTAHKGEIGLRSDVDETVFWLKLPVRK